MYYYFFGSQCISKKKEEQISHEAKKDKEIERLKEAADEVSKGKLSQRRNRERQEKKKLEKVTNTLSSLKF